MIRLFVAIPLPEAQRERLRQLCHGVRDARWVAPENLHLTLRFIGEVAEPTGNDIANALADVRGATFPLRLHGVGHFETGRKVRTLWAGIDRSPPLNHLQERIESAIRRGGAAPDSRRFTAHVTLARLKSAPAHKVGNWVESNALFAGAPFTVDRFILYESFLSQSGAIHSPVETYTLADTG